jgi:hypothetical protein
VKTYDGKVRCEFGDGFNGARAAEAVHIESEDYKIETAVSRFAQNVHRVTASRGVMARNAKRRDQLLSQNLIVITNHYTRHPVYFLIPRACAGSENTRPSFNYKTKRVPHP